MSNQINTTTPTVSGLQNSSPVAGGSQLSSSELELGCINLISQLEIQIASAKESRTDHIENAGENGEKLLTVLLDFCTQYIGEAEAAQPLQEIERASFASLALKQAIGSLGWGFAISNLFGKSVCSDEKVRESYDALGQSLLTACVSVLRQAILAVGPDSEIGQTIEQSTAVFAEEFNANW